MPKANKFTLDEIKNWKPDHNDFSYGRTLIITEDYSKTVQRFSSNPDDPFSSENLLFCGLAYVILSLREKFNINKEQFHAILNNDMGTTSAVLKNPEKLERILSPYGLGKQKFDSIHSAATEWKALNLTERMRNDVNKRSGKKLRVEMVKKIHGVGFKFASLWLRMCGYHNIAPPDAWGIKYCESRGYIFRRENSGPSFSQSAEYEKILIRDAKKYDASPALFQATIYARWSTWRMDSGVDPQYR